MSDKVKNALVLGTGGSSLAVCFVLENLGIRVIKVSRNRKPGAVCYQDIDSELLKNNQLIINTTPLGMFPDIESKPDIDYRMLSEEHILFDLVYNPEITSFLRMGNGDGMQNHKRNKDAMVTG